MWTLNVCLVCFEERNNAKYSKTVVITSPGVACNRSERDSFCSAPRPFRQTRFTLYYRTFKMESSLKVKSPDLDCTRTKCPWNSKMNPGLRSLYRLGNGVVLFDSQRLKKILYFMTLKVETREQKSRTWGLSCDGYRSSAVDSITGKSRCPTDVRTHLWIVSPSNFF